MFTRNEQTKNALSKKRLTKRAQMKGEVKGLAELGVRRAGARNENENSLLEKRCSRFFGG